MSMRKVGYTLIRCKYCGRTSYTKKKSGKIKCTFEFCGETLDVKDGKELARKDWG